MYRRRRLAALVVSVACLGAAGGIAAAVLDSGTGSGRRHTASPPPDQARRTVDSMSAIVAASAADRSRVIAAIDEVQSCTLSASQGQAVVESVVNDRRASVSQLERLSSARPDAVSTALVNDLVATLDASISDDLSYMSWMADIAGGHAACGANPMSDPNFAAAKDQSDRTNSYKQIFVQGWNPVASRYGKQTYQAQDF